MNRLYIIHGWTYRPEAWHEVIRALKKYDIDAELLKVPGLGTQSDKVFTIQDYSDWAKNRLPKGSIALGHSNGGRILLNMLSREGSDYLGGLILLDAAGIYEKSFKRDASKKLSKAFSPLKKIPLARKVVHKVLGANDYDQAPDNMKETLDNMLTSDQKLDISGITTNTEIIWGSDDKVTPLRQGKKMHELLQNSELTIKKGWRHSHYLVNVEELAAEISAKYQKLSKKESE